MEMEKSNVPRSFGVFKPVGHTLISVRSAQDLDIAVAAFKNEGFSDKSLIQYSPEEMAAQVDLDFINASPLAGAGSELNLSKVHRDLAQKGFSFLVVYAPEDEQAELVDRVIETIKPVQAQRYSRFIIEELVPPTNALQD